MRVRLQMMVAFNSQERTIGQFINLVEGTGWRLKAIGRSFGSSVCLMVLKPGLSDVRITSQTQA